MRLHRVPLSQTEDTVRELARLLGEEERERARAFRFERHRRRFLVRRGALRHILGGALGRPPEGLVFTTGPRGRPELAGIGAPPLRFSVSHSSEECLVAVTGSGRIGVDLERIRPIRERDAIAERTFSPAEARMLRALPEAERLPAFFRVWTQKEAFVKALGEGLYFELDRFDVGVPPSEPGILRVDDRRAPELPWRVRTLAPAPGYVAALVLDRPTGAPEPVTWTAPGADPRG